MLIDQLFHVNDNIRPYLARFRLVSGHCCIEQRKKRVMMHSWFENPSNVYFLHSFARNEGNVGYVYHMVRLVNLVAWTGEER